MPAPIIPLQKTDWASPIATQADNVRFDPQVGGLIEVAKNGLNNNRQTYNVGAFIQNRDELESFLMEAGGGTFQFDWDGTAHPEILWRCESYGFVRDAENWWRFSAVFKQFRRFGV